MTRFRSPPPQPRAATRGSSPPRPTPRKYCFLEAARASPPAAGRRRSFSYCRQEQAEPRGFLRAPYFHATCRVSRAVRPPTGGQPQLRPAPNPERAGAAGNRPPLPAQPPPGSGGGAEPPGGGARGGAGRPSPRRSAPGEGRRSGARRAGARAPRGASPRRTAPRARARPVAHVTSFRGRGRAPPARETPPGQPESRGGAA